MHGGTRGTYGPAGPGHGDRQAKATLLELRPDVPADRETAHAVPGLLVQDVTPSGDLRDEAFHAPVPLHEIAVPARQPQVADVVAAALGAWRDVIDGQAAGLEAGPAPEALRATGWWAGRERKLRVRRRC
ncbi:MAG: hypothetical protein OXH76_07920 [Boseongicola sp.]|nr:hypothetical protein [Boseongicola sp.]